MASERVITEKVYLNLNFQVKSAVSSIIGSRKGTSGGQSHGTGGLGAAAGLGHKSGGNGKLLKKVGKYAVVGLAGKSLFNFVYS